MLIELVVELESVIQFCNSSGGSIDMIDVMWDEREVADGLKNMLTWKKNTRITLFFKFWTQL